MKAGPVGVVCPVCDETILVPIECEIDNNEEAWLGGAAMTCTPDLADLWAHAWTHDTPRTTTV